VIVVRNWRDVCPTIAHKSGVDWRLLSMVNKTRGDIDAEVEEKYMCLKAITYVSLAHLQPTLSYEKHQHQDHDIINGKGKIRIGDEESLFRDGDIIYIPERTGHTITNNGEETIEFLAFGGFMSINSQQEN
jgi:uncharacterized cupin superfamily protein